MTASVERRGSRARVLRGGILLGFAALVAKLFAAGQMSRYMAPALDPLTALTGVALGVMGAMEIAGSRRRERGHGHSSEPFEQLLTYVLVLLPLGLGLVLIPRALGPGALGGESVARLLLAYAPDPTPSQRARPPAPSRAVADTADLLRLLREAGMAGAGQRVRATGLAVRAGGLGADEFALLRYAIAHCVADARPLALLVSAPDTREVTWDRWVEVEGVLAVSERDGTSLVTIAADRVRPVPEPAEPYLGSAF